MIVVLRSQQYQAHPNEPPQIDQIKTDDLQFSYSLVKGLLKILDLFTTEFFEFGVRVPNVH